MIAPLAIAKAITLQLKCVCCISKANAKKQKPQRKPISLGLRKIKAVGRLFKP